MKQLVKDGKVIFDGIHNQNELTEMAFKQLENLYFVMEVIKETHTTLYENIERWLISK